MLSTLYLVRHGEVHNPEEVVYADLPGFGLSSLGTAQAAALADHLEDAPIDAILCSPLLRARQTAFPLAARLTLPIVADDRLTEWGLGRCWAGAPWDRLPDLFPGELEAYLSTPTTLAFAPESIATVARRMTDVVLDASLRHPGGTVVIVSHQDPVQALRLSLRGHDLATLHQDKPMHAGVISLEHHAGVWSETGNWTPEQRSVPFPPVEPPRPT